MIANKISYKRIVILLVSLTTIPLTMYVSSKVNFNFGYVNKKEEFSEDNLILYLKKTRIRFPYIVLAQARLESGNYTSFIFINNNNLFGMKHPAIRTTTSLGTKFGYAYYSNWEESVIDYGIYSSKYIPDMSSENDYYEFLDKYYTQDPEYSKKLKLIVENIKSKNIF